jgi:hypothetical protein
MTACVPAADERLNEVGATVGEQTQDDNSMQAHTALGNQMPLHPKQSSPSSKQGKKLANIMIGSTLRSRSTLDACRSGPQL